MLGVSGAWGSGGENLDVWVAVCCVRRCLFEIAEPSEGCRISVKGAKGTSTA